MPADASADVVRRIGICTRQAVAAVSAQHDHEPRTSDEPQTRRSPRVQPTPRWTDPHAMKRSMGMQHGLWITLWRMCAKRRRACAQHLWKTPGLRQSNRLFLAFDRLFLPPHPVDQDVLEVVIEGFVTRVSPVHNSGGSATTRTPLGGREIDPDGSRHRRATRGAGWTPGRPSRRFDSPGTLRRVSAVGIAAIRHGR